MGLHAVGAHNWWDTQHQHHRALDSGDPHTSNFRGARHGIRLQSIFFIFLCEACEHKWASGHAYVPNMDLYLIKKKLIARSHVANMYMLELLWISHDSQSTRPRAGWEGTLLVGSCLTIIFSRDSRTCVGEAGRVAIIKLVCALQIHKLWHMIFEAIENMYICCIYI